MFRVTFKTRVSVTSKTRQKKKIHKKTRRMTHKTPEILPATTHCTATHRHKNRKRHKNHAFYKIHAYRGIDGSLNDVGRVGEGIEPDEQECVNQHKNACTHARTGGGTRDQPLEADRCNGSFDKTFDS